MHIAILPAAALASIERRPSASSPAHSGYRRLLYAWKVMDVHARLRLIVPSTYVQESPVLDPTSEQDTWVYSPAGSCIELAVDVQAEEVRPDLGQHLCKDKLCKLLSHPCKSDRRTRSSSKRSRSSRVLSIVMRFVPLTSLTPPALSLHGQHPPHQQPHPQRTLTSRCSVSPRQSA